MSRRRLGVLSAVLVLLAGCSSAPDRPTMTTVVIPREGKAVRAAEEASGDPAGPSEPEIRKRLDDVRRLLRIEDYGEALARLDTLRGFKLPAALDREAEALRVEVKQHLLQSMYADAVVVADHERSAIGDPITGELVVANLSREPLTIPARAATGGGRGSVSESTLRVEVLYREYGLDGTVATERVSWNLSVGADLVLAPGERHAWPLSLDTLQFNPSSLNYRTYTVDGTLYPAGLRVGDEEFPGTLRFRPKTFAVFPRNFEHLAAEPLRRLREAIAKGSPPHVPLAAALLDEAAREEAIEVLATSLARPSAEPPDAATRLACCVALRILTGEELPPESEAWLAWHQDHRKPRE